MRLTTLLLISYILSGCNPPPATSEKKAEPIASLASTVSNQNEKVFVIDDNYEGTLDSLQKLKGKVVEIRGKVLFNEVFCIAPTYVISAGKNHINFKIISLISDKFQADINSTMRFRGKLDIEEKDEFYIHRSKNFEKHFPSEKICRINQETIIQNLTDTKPVSAIFTEETKTTGSLNDFIDKKIEIIGTFKKVSNDRKLFWGFLRIGGETIYIYHTSPWFNKKTRLRATLINRTRKVSFGTKVDDQSDQKKFLTLENFELAELIKN